MIAGVADTHAAVWFFSGDSQLSTPAKEFFFKAAAERNKIALSSISLAEVVYLIEKNRLPVSAYEVQFNSEVVETMRQVPRFDVPDMPDRIVAATGLYFSVPVISRDGRIRALNIQTVW